MSIAAVTASIPAFAKTIAARVVAVPPRTKFPPPVPLVATISILVAVAIGILLVFSSGLTSYVVGLFIVLLVFGVLKDWEKLAASRRLIKREGLRNGID